MQILDDKKLNKLIQIEKVKVLNCACGSTECKVEGIPQYDWDKAFKDDADKRKKKQIDHADPQYGGGLDEEEQKTEKELSNGLPIPKLF